MTYIFESGLAHHIEGLIQQNELMDMPIIPKKSY